MKFFQRAAAVLASAVICASSLLCRPSDHAQILTPDFSSVQAADTADSKLNPHYGVDVSQFQGWVNWDKVFATRIEFVVLRLAGCEHNTEDAKCYKDKRFDSFYKRCAAQAKKTGMKLDVYFYTTANTKQEMLDSVSDALSFLKDDSYINTIWIDIEDDQHKKCSKSELTDITLTGLNALKAKGYHAGVYSNHEFFTQYLDADKIQAQGFDLWYAQWLSKKKNYADSVQISQAPFPQALKKARIWQYGISNNFPGFGTDVDLDVYFSPASEPKSTAAAVQTVTTVTTTTSSETTTTTTTTTSETTTTTTTITTTTTSSSETTTTTTTTSSQPEASQASTNSSSISIYHLLFDHNSDGHMNLSDAVSMVHSADNLPNHRGASLIDFFFWIASYL